MTKVWTNKRLITFLLVIALLMALPGISFAAPQTFTVSFVDGYARKTIS